MAEWLTPLARKANASIGLEDMGSNPIRIKFFTQVKFSNSNRIFQKHFYSVCLYDTVISFNSLQFLDFSLFFILFVVAYLNVSDKLQRQHNLYHVTYQCEGNWT